VHYRSETSNALDALVYQQTGETVI